MIPNGAPEHPFEIQLAQGIGYKGTEDVASSSVAESGGELAVHGGERAEPLAHG